MGVSGREQVSEVKQGTFLSIREIKKVVSLKLGKIRRDCFITRLWAPRTCFCQSVGSGENLTGFLVQPCMIGLRKELSKHTAI